MSQLSKENLKQETASFQKVLLQIAKMESANLQDSLKKIVELDAKTLGVERVSIWFFVESGTEIRCDVLFKLKENLYEAGATLRASDYPHYFQAMEESRTIAAHEARTDPVTREFTDNYLIPLGITSMMDVPIRSQGRVVGIVCHEHVGTAREWSPDEQEFAASIADMVSLSMESWERRRAEEALQKTTEELIRSNKELERFAYVASHDLQEPLHKVIGFSDRLREIYGHGLDERGRDYLERIERAASGMRSLIEDLLRFARITTRAKSFERVDLNEVLQEIKSDLELRLSETGGTLEVHSLPTLPADRIQMHQLFQNLIVNALKFCERETQPHVVVQGEKWGTDRVAISVTDNGIGIEEEYLGEIFKPFQRLHGKAEYDGSGIGLALCEKIVKRHGGEISVKSEKGKGSTFTIFLRL